VGALADRFVDYLRGGASGDARPLAAALTAEGYPLEGALIGRENDGWTTAPHGAWSGARTFVGRRPPDTAAAGELWLDTVEVMPMILVEEPARRADRPPTTAWLAIRPTARWQFRAFVAAAPLVGREVQVDPLQPPLAAERIDAGPDAAPMTAVTHGEATLYGWWFGKVLAGQNQWEGAARTLGDRLAALWAPGIREWVMNEPSFDEGLRIRVGADSWDKDPHDEHTAEEDGDPPDPETRMLIGQLGHRPNTGFRTTVPSFVGLLDSVDSVTVPEPLALARLFAR
jgi:hypothetical protein